MTMLVRIVLPLILLVALYVEASTSSWKKMKKKLSKLSPKRRNEDKTPPGKDDRGEISCKKTRSGLFSITKEKNKDEAKEKDQGEEGKDETPTEEKNEHKDSSEGQHFEAPSESRSDKEPVTPMFESDDPFKSILDTKKEPSEFLWKRKHQKVPSDDTPQSPTSSSDIPFLYGL
ncbi:hypothetical protein FOZ61_006615, partial [Perkinsus olseni]